MQPYEVLTSPEIPKKLRSSLRVVSAANWFGLTFDHSASTIQMQGYYDLEFALKDLGANVTLNYKVRLDI